MLSTLISANIRRRTLIFTHYIDMLLIHPQLFFYYYYRMAPYRDTTYNYCVFVREQCNNYCCCCQAFEGVFHQGLSSLSLENARHVSCDCFCVGLKMPSNDPVRPFGPLSISPFVRSSFFVLSCQ